MNDVDRSWIKRYQRTAQELPVRRDMVIMLTYLQSNKVTGTQSLGNLPLKAVREITAMFVNPPVLDHNIGERVYKLRSEDEVWPLVFLHAIAEVGELMTGGRSRRLKLTQRGDEFLSMPPYAQAKYMFLTWWTRVNWLIAYPFAGMGDDLPPHFGFYTLSSLLGLRVGLQIDFECFADDLIKRTDLRWTSEDTTHHRRLLHRSIERMVIIVLADFGVVKVSYREEIKYKVTFKELDTFELTDFGQDLLTMVYLMG